MQPKLFAVLGLALLCPVGYAQNSATAPSYTFVSMNVPFSGASNTKPFDINPAGEIVGRYFDGTEGNKVRGFLRRSDGTFGSPIDAPVPNTGTVPRSINAPGDIAGKYFDPFNPNATHGFFLSAGGVFISFDVSLSTAISGTTVANGLNNLGQIVGSYAAFTSVPGCGATLIPVGHSFLRNKDGSFTAIDFPGATGTDARSIDDGGNIVGSYFVVSSSNTTCGISTVVSTHGFVRDSKGNYTTLDVPPTAPNNTLIFRNNEAGDVAGLYTSSTVTYGDLIKDTPAPSGLADFVLSSTGNFASFYVVLGGNEVGGLILGINPRGTIVGVYTDANGDHGFIGTKVW